MSVKLEHIYLSDDKRKVISEFLNIEARVYKKKFYKKEVPKQMFLMDEKYVYLPYRFACSLSGKIENNDDKPCFKNIKFEGELRDYQKEIFEESWRYLISHRTLTIGMPPAWGKTTLSALLWHKIGMMGLILTHRKCISKQWLETFESYFPSLGGCFWAVGINKAPEENQIPAVIICLVDRFEIIPQSLRDKVGVLIMDEAHALCTSTAIPALLGTQPKYSIAISATLERNDKLETMIQSIVGTHGVFAVSKKPYTVICVKTGIRGNERMTPDGIDFVYLIKSLMENPFRNEIILNFIKKHRDKKIIGLTRLTEHINIISEGLEKENIKCDTLYGNKEKYSDSDVLLGTVQKIGTGFDEERACEDYQGTPSNMVLFMLTVGMWQIFEQGRGRVMRTKESPVVVWFLDENDTCQRHWNKLQSWIKETNGTIIYHI